MKKKLASQKLQQIETLLPYIKITTLLTQFLNQFETARNFRRAILENGTQLQSTLKELNRSFLAAHKITFKLNET